MVRLMTTATLKLRDSLGEALVRENNLLAEIAKLRAALEQIAREHRWPSHFTVTDCRRIARAALANEQETK